MDKVIRACYSIDMTGNDIKYLTHGKSRVVLYDNLTVNDDIVRVIGPTKQVLLLFPTTANPTTGHWLALTIDGKTISHFDSYGLAPHAELRYSQNPNVKADILGQLYAKATLQGYKIVWNTVDLQEMSRGNNQCGRFAAIRNRFHFLTLPQFAALFKGQKLSPDYLITILTFLSISHFDNRTQELITQNM